MQILLSELIQNREQRNAVLIVSSMIQEEHLLPAISRHHDEIPALNRCIEEADSRLIVHTKWDLVVDKSKRIIVISNYADTFALL